MRQRRAVLLGVLCILGCMAGCTHEKISPTFMLVDVATNAPLQKAVVCQMKHQWQPANPGWYPVDFPTPDPTQTRKTNAQGRVTYTDVYADRPFQADADGYSSIMWKMQSDGRVHIIRRWTYDLYIRKDASGVYTIPLWPRPKYEMNPTQ